MKSLLAALSLLSVASLAHADLVNPSLLKNSPDGANTTVQSELDTLFSPVSVDTDQVAGELFELCNPQSPATFSLLFQHAGQGPFAKLGYYTDLGNPNPSVVWVVGGSSSGMPTSDTVFLPSTTFGLALASGDASDGGTVYYSQTAKNPDSVNHMGALSLAKNTGDECDILTVWEDLNGGGDMDYNDDAVRVQNIHAVPEPVSLTVLGLGALAAMRKRKTN